MSEIDTTECQCKQKDARIEDLEAEVKKLKSERENWRMSSVCRQHEERIKELVSIGEFQDRTAQISLEYIGQLQEQNERLRDILVHLLKLVGG